MALSGLSKYKIAVDAASLADGDSIAAYLTSAAGDLITSTTVGAKEALDALTQAEHLDGSAYAAGVDYLSSMGVVDNNGDWVPLTLDANGNLPVSATIDFAGDYAEDSAHVSGDIGLFTLSVRRDTRASGTSADGDYASFNTNSVGELYVKDTDVATALTAANASLDAIEASTAAIESDVDAIRVELLDQGTTLDAILADTATIDSQTLSIQNTLTALSKAEDAAAASGDQGIQALAVRKDALSTNVSADGDYSSLLTWSEGSLKAVDVANISFKNTRVTLATANTAQQLAASAHPHRRNILIQNLSDKSIFIGPDNTVTTSSATTGIEIPQKAAYQADWGPNVTVWAVCGSNSKDLLITESA